MTGIHIHADIFYNRVIQTSNTTNHVSLQSDLTKLKILLLQSIL